MAISETINLGREFYFSKRLLLSTPTSKVDFLAKHRNLFEIMRVKIEKVLQDTEYFHGTGAKHYTNMGNSKYDGHSFEKISDSLQSFLIEGLKTQKDLFNETFETGIETTISLTRSQIYAGLYAKLFLTENEEFEYEFGSRKFWWRAFLSRMAINAITDSDFMKEQVEILKKRLHPTKKIEYQHNRKIRDKMASVWTNSFRSDNKYAKNAFLAMEKATSDIPGNFPVILGIRSGIEELSIKYKPVSMYEQRTKDNISPDNFSHIQVPLKKLEEVQNRVKEVQLDLLVIPIEFAELIASEVPILKHLTPKQSRN